MRDFLFADEHAAFFQQLDDDGIRFENRLALVFRQALDEAAVVVLRRVGFQTIFLAGAKIVRAVARSGVHDAAALIERHVIGQDAGNLQIEKWMLELHAFEGRAFPFAAHFVNFHVQFGFEGVHALFRQQQFSRGRIRDDVLELRMKREGAVRGQRPGRGGPDERADVAVESQLFRFFARNHRKPHPDGRTGVVLVFHFGFGQRGAVEDAPVHGLQAAIDVTLLVKIEKRAGDRSLIARVHREVRPVPLAQNTQALEFDLVLLDEPRGKLAAHAAKFRRRHFAGLAAQFLFDFRLDRQSVAIPAGNVGRAKSGHGLGLHDHVFHDFVQAGAQMDFARGIRRPIVQHKERRIRARFQNAVIETLRFPGSELLRLALGQLGFHGKICLRKVQGTFQVHRFGHL